MQPPGIQAQIDVIAAFLTERGIGASESTILALMEKLTAARKGAVATPSLGWNAAAGPMSDAQYVGRHGICCPSCSSTEDTSGSQLTVDNGTASQPMVCGACDAEWSDMYTLIGYSDLEGGINLETIQAVVDDVKTRFGADKFSTESDARTHIDDSCVELGEQLSDGEMKIAVEQLTS